MRRRISQREAHALRKRVKQLEAQRTLMLRYFAADWTGVQILSGVALSDAARDRIWTASRLQHVVVARVKDGKVDFHALEVTP